MAKGGSGGCIDGISHLHLFERKEIVQISKLCIGMTGYIGLAGRFGQLSQGEKSVSNGKKDIN